MDKSQRKLLRRRDEYHGARNQPLVPSPPQTQVKHQYIRDTMMAYKPCPTTFLARALAMSLEPWFQFTTHSWWSDDSEIFSSTSRLLTLQSHRVRVGRLWRSIDWTSFLAGSDQARLSLYLQPDPYEAVRTNSDVKREIARLQAERDDRYIARHAHECIRTLRRTDTIKSELLAAYPRMQAILACHRIKEELYMNVYHPRRIENLLETGGWEALENFIGL